jgi:hypothetical protein
MKAVRLVLNLVEQRAASWVRRRAVSSAAPMACCLAAQTVESKVVQRAVYLDWSWAEPWAELKVPSLAEQKVGSTAVTRDTHWAVSWGLPWVASWAVQKELNWAATMAR